jgi:hypothetical protein
MIVVHKLAASCYSSPRFSFYLVPKFCLYAPQRAQTSMRQKTSIGLPWHVWRFHMCDLLRLAHAHKHQPRRHGQSMRVIARQMPTACNNFAMAQYLQLISDRLTVFPAEAIHDSDRRSLLQSALPCPEPLWPSLEVLHTASWAG